MLRIGTCWKWLLAIAGVVAVCVGITTVRTSRSSDTSVVANAAEEQQLALTGADQSAGGTNLQSLPSSLDGTTAPRLPVDTNGRLARTRAVRDFFDYFLTAQDAVPAKALDELVRRSIAAQLDGRPAPDDALAVWQRYNAYRTACAQLTPPGSMLDGKPDFNALQLVIDQRSSLADRVMGEWSEAFFGDELHQQRDDLARLRIASDTTLSDAEKRARLAMLDAALPQNVRAARERAREQQASIDAVAQMLKQGASPDAVRAQVAQTLGSDAAERVVQMQKDEQQWQTRYADYEAQRAQIGRIGLSPQDYDTQVQQLRQRLFPNAGDAMRVASLDQDSGNRVR
ncbi:lipase secretion chaperone [Paraburkholderia ginsengisoli]|uniref:Lipase chaperone n=1 Tax=Paraburkholderia ginsengisoli TaxID=311231 RepID=A0A7T4N9W6_9BURK|nr:lipase secretion chaperone [Paraburkholderia ginsengisoli]QQC67919.1 lipase secretion chaperone [Paraburkholderia ginsengisoli]